MHSTEPVMLKDAPWGVAQTAVAAGRFGGTMAFVTKTY